MISYICNTALLLLCTVVRIHHPTTEPPSTTLFKTYWWCCLAGENCNRRKSSTRQGRPLKRRWRPGWLKAWWCMRAGTSGIAPQARSTWKLNGQYWYHTFYVAPLPCYILEYYIYIYPGHPVSSQLVVWSMGRFKNAFWLATVLPYSNDIDLTSLKGIFII